MFYILEGQQDTNAMNIGGLSMLGVHGYSNMPGRSPMYNDGRMAVAEDRDQCVNLKPSLISLLCALKFCTTHECVHITALKTIVIDNTL